MGRNDDQIRCSFCNKSQAQVKKLIAGPNDTYICDECVEVCSEIIEEEMAKKYRILDNKLAEKSSFDEDQLLEEWQKKREKSMER